MTAKSSGCGQVGLGSENALFKVYIANRPPLPEYQQLKGVAAMQPGEIAHIAATTGNHWRKIFNVYAKLIAAYKQQCGEPLGYPRWQDYRDQQLLQQHSDEALIFSPPQLNRQLGSVRLVLAKGYAGTLGLNDELHWLDTDFAVHAASGIVVCPYFDYRQLSDIKIQRLVHILTGEL